MRLLCPPPDDENCSIHRMFILAGGNSLEAPKEARVAGMGKIVLAVEELFVIAEVLVADVPPDSFGYVDRKSCGRRLEPEREGLRSPERRQRRSDDGGRR